MVIPFLVISGVAKESLHTMDDGRSRTLGQKFYIDGEKAPDVLASMIQLLAVYRKRGKFSGPNYSALEYYEVLEAEKDAARPLAKEYKCKTPRNLKPGLIATLHLLFAEKDPQLAATFCSQIMTGVGAEKGEPAREFRDWVISLEKGEVRVPQIAAVLIDCWNKECRGENITRIRIPKNLPKIEGPVTA
jgi:glutamate synthase domain-containing protein 1